MSSKLSMSETASSGQEDVTCRGSPASLPPRRKVPAQEATVLLLAEFLNLALPPQKDSLHEQIAALGAQTEYVLILIAAHGMGERENRVQYANWRFTEATGIDAAEVVGSDFVSLQTKKTHVFLKRHIAQSLQAGTVLSCYPDFRTESGGALRTLLTLLPCHDEGGVFTHCIALISWRAADRAAHEAGLRPLELAVIASLGEHTSHRRFVMPRTTSTPQPPASAPAPPPPLALAPRSRASLCPTSTKREGVAKATPRLADRPPTHTSPLRRVSAPTRAAPTNATPRSKAFTRNASPGATATGAVPFKWNALRGSISTEFFVDARKQEYVKEFSQNAQDAARTTQVLPLLSQPSSQGSSSSLDALPRTTAARSLRGPSQLCPGRRNS